MSISVDDLVASFSANHIGQEALDLAALQAQLAQTLLCQTISSSPTTQNTFRRGPSNTPTSRTPTSSFLDHSGFLRRRSSSVASIQAQRAGDDRDWDISVPDEDEQMVEDLLFPSSPVQSTATAAHFPASGYPATPISPVSAHYSTQSRTSGMSSQSFSHAYHDNSNASLFASTDPFYLAQLQASQNTSSSIFTQTGRPSQHSPFVMSAAMQSPHSHSFSHHFAGASEMDARGRYVTPAAVYNR